MVFRRSEAQVVASLLGKIETPEQAALVGRFLAALARARQFKNASTVIDSRLQKDPENGEALAGKGWGIASDIFDRTRPTSDFEEALNLFQEGLLHSPESISILHDYANLLVTCGEGAQKALAINLSDRALEINPGDTEAMQIKAIALSQLRRHAGSLSVCEKIIEADPGNREALIFKGWNLYYLSHYREAIAAFDRALELWPDVAPLLAYRGSMLAALEQREEALASINRALEIEPDYTTALGLKIDILRALGRIEEAGMMPPMEYHL
jgi:tetratricopeptide (TPR) repeat protein